MKTALIVSGGGFQGLTLLRALQQREDVRVIVCDIFSENPTRYLCPDYRVAPLLSDEPAFTRFLLTTAEENHIDVVFPSTAYELPILATLRNQLESLGTHVAVSGQGLLATLLDKLSAYQWVRANELPAPETFDPATFAFDAPLFGRPRHGWGGRGAVVLHNQDAGQHNNVTPADYVWTRWLAEFDEFSLDFAIGVHGSISPISIRQRLRASGGFAVVSQSMADVTLQALAKRIAEAIQGAGGCGLFNVQVLRTANECFISDINPRSGTSSTHALAEGINLPGFFMDTLQDSGEQPYPLPPRKIVKTARLLKDITIPRLASRPKGIIFDLDDTLVDHKLWMLKKIEAVHGQCLAGEVKASDFMLCAARLIDEGVRSDLIDRLLAELSLSTGLRDNLIQAYRAQEIADTPLFPDVEPILLALKRQGFSIGLVTDNPPATQQSKLANAPILKLLDAAVYTREHGAEKPHEAGFVQIARSLSLEPSQLVMIGDNYFRDGLGAIRAGYMHALIVQRNGTFLSHHPGIARQLALDEHKHIDFVDSLVSAYHACDFS